jgi:MarR-like DNA-binding transcriptional regulator SgrR of sgrS sRNA
MVGCQNQRDDTWDVVSVWLPPEISPNMIHGNSVFYIVRQTHEPILRVADNNSLFSNILKDWTRSEDYKSFKFCIKDKLEFDTGISFTTESLFQSIEKLKPRFKGLAITKNDNCVEVKIDQPAKPLLDLLTNLEFAPTFEDKKTGWHLGLGPYKVVQKDSEQVILKRKIPILNGFNTIRMTSISGSAKELESRNIEDFNLLPVEKIPKWTRQEYKSFPVSLLKVYGLVVNVKDKLTRKAIYNCLNIDNFRKIYFPKDKMPVDVASIFPIGIEGASPGKIKQICNNESFLKTKRALTLANWKPEVEKELESVFKDLFKSTNIQVTVKNYDASVLGDLLLKKQSGYDLMVVALDSTNEEYLPFFESFLEPSKRFHTVDLSRLKSDYLDLKKADTKQKIVSIAQKLNTELLDEAVFVPILQQTREYFFPKDLKELNLGSNFLGYLEIGNIRL